MFYIQNRKLYSEKNMYVEWILSLETYCTKRTPMPVKNEFPLGPSPLNYQPVSSVKSSLQSSVLRIPARRAWYSFFPGQFWQHWLSFETAAVRNPWSAWWDEGDGPTCGQWRCPKAWWSRGWKEGSTSLR